MLNFIKFFLIIHQFIQNINSRKLEMSEANSYELINSQFKDQFLAGIDLLVRAADTADREVIIFLYVQYFDSIRGVQLDNRKVFS